MSTRARRERRLVAALGATLLALVAAVALVVRDDRRAAAARSTAVPVDTASRVVISRDGRTDIALERVEGDWRVIAPCALDANDARLEPLLGALGGGTLDYPAGEVDLEAAGLDAPRAVIRLDGTPTSLGGTDLGGERRYALREGRVALVPEWTLSLVDGGLSALAEPAPFAEAPVSLRRVDAEGDELDPAPWGELAASQIVVWPVSDAPPETRRTRLEASLADGGTRTFELVGNASWNALRPDGDGCAWLFPDDALPSDAYP